MRGVCGDGFQEVVARSVTREGYCHGGQGGVHKSGKGPGGSNLRLAARILFYLF